MSAPHALPLLLALAPEGGGVGDAFSHDIAELSTRGGWRVEAIRVSQEGWPARHALAILARRRSAFARADAIHVEFGSNDATLFWLALLLTARHRAVTVVIHDYPKLITHPAAGLLPDSRRWQVVVGHRLLSPLLDRLLKDLLLRRASAVALMSDAAKSGWSRRVRGALVVLPHGAFPLSEVSMPPSRGGHVLFAGFIGPSKGLDTLLEAWESVGASSPLPLVIAGSAPAGTDGEVEQMKVRSARYDSPPRWLGYIPSESDLQDVIATAALVVLPYRSSNPASGILARAMLEGRAIVATRVPATVGIIRDGVDGLLTPPDDPAELASAIESILQDPARRDRLGRSAAERAQALFSGQARSAMLVRAYDACRSAPSARGRYPAD